MKFNKNFFDMRESLVLVGGGYNARNIIGLFEASGLKVSFIVDDNPCGSLLGFDVKTMDVLANSETNTLLTVMKPELAKKIRNKPELQKCKWQTLIHPSAIVSSYCEFNRGVVIGPFTSIPEAKLEQHVHIFTHSALGSGVEVGEFSAILPHVMIASGAKIGRGTVLAMGARINKGVKIGDNCHIAPNVFVKNDVPDNSMVFTENSKTIIVSKSNNVN